MVALLERSGDRQMVWPTPTTVQNLQVGGHGSWRCVQIQWKRRWFVGICSRKHGLVASCSKPWKLEDSFRNVERALYRWSRVPRGTPGRMADATWSTWKSYVRWCRAGYGWLDSYVAVTAVEILRTFCSARRAEWPFGDVARKC